MLFKCFFLFHFSNRSREQIHKRKKIPHESSSALNYIKASDQSFPESEQA